MPAVKNAERLVEVVALGGANEVGASATIIKVAGVSILIDAGVRVGGAKRGGPLPSFELIKEAPDVMLVTHAHMDHTGALPGVVPRLGKSLIHMTTPTLHLLQALQGDSAASSSKEEDNEGTKTSYSSEEVEAMFSLIVAQGFCQPFYPIPNREDIVVEFWPNGHILGSASILIDTPEARIVWMGDYSVTPQPTIGGLNLQSFTERLSDRPVDVLVSEGTYGVSVHPARVKESERFLDLLEDVAERGGKTLIPAFALGRAQDLVHTIREGKLAGRLSDVPVYLDGMTQPVTVVYQNIAHQSYPHMKEPLVLLDPEHQIMKANAQSRAKIMSGEAKGPCIVIASSGMLIGGKSVEYAKAFAGDRKNAIFLSGYQDEESPGRKLLGLRRGSKWHLADGTKMTVKCTFGRYHTSAHADGAQIQEVIRALSPKHTALVHGDAPSLQALALAIGHNAKVLVNGEAWTVSGSEHAWKVVAPKERPVAALGKLPDLKEIRNLWEHLSQRGARDYSDRELATMILGPRYTTVALAQLNNCLEQYRLYFHTGSKIGERSYRPRTQDELVEMMCERNTGSQIPLTQGEIVIFADGSPDLFAGLVINVEKTDVEGLVAGNSKRQFKREWIRGKTSIGAEDIIAEGVRPAGAMRWLDAVVREARTLSGWNMVELFWSLQQKDEKKVSVLEALSIMGNKEPSAAERIAMAFCLAGAKTLFEPSSEGDFKARTFEEAAKRNRSFARLKLVKEAGPGAQIQLVTGEWVSTTGTTALESFEAVTESNRTVRINYRRVLLPGERPQPPILKIVKVAKRKPTYHELKEGRNHNRRKRARRGPMGVTQVDNILPAEILPVVLPDGRVVIPDPNSPYIEGIKAKEAGDRRGGKRRRRGRNRRKEKGSSNGHSKFNTESEASPNHGGQDPQNGQINDFGPDLGGLMDPGPLAGPSESPPLC